MSSSRSPYLEVKLATHGHSHEGPSQYSNSGIRLTKRVPSAALSHGPNPSAPKVLCEDVVYSTDHSASPHL